MHKLLAFLEKHPEIMVLVTGALLVQAGHNFVSAVELRNQIRRRAADFAREASEALGG